MVEEKDEEAVATTPNLFNIPCESRDLHVQWHLISPCTGNNGPPQAVQGSHQKSHAHTHPKD